MFQYIVDKLEKIKKQDETKLDTSDFGINEEDIKFIKALIKGVPDQVI